MRNRRKARELALQVLYQMDVREISAEKALRLIFSRYRFKPTVRKFSEMLVRGVYQYLLPINFLIEEYAKNWTLERMAIVDRNILRLVIYELLLLKEIPAAVSINEAVDIAKRYGTKDSGKFVNGILDKIHRERGRDSCLKWSYLKSVLCGDSYLGKLLEIKGGEKLWLVGGYLRDHLLDKKSKDLDLIVEDPEFKVAQRFAREMRANLFALSSTTRRSVLPDGIIIDFNLKSSASLKMDLLQRDFTINALALDLDCLEIPSLTLIDPYTGLEDLINKKIKLISKKSLEDDPLRMLRAFRLASQLNFTIEDEITSFIKQKSFLIRKTSKERIRDELFLLFKNSSSYEYLKNSSLTAILKEVFKATPNIENVKRIEMILSKKKIISGNLKKKIISHLEKKKGSVRKRGELLKFITLIFPPSPENYNLSPIARKLKLTQREIRIIKKIEKIYPWLKELERKQGDPELIARFFIQAKEETIEILLLFLTENLENDRFSKLAICLLGEYFQKSCLILKPPELINAENLIKSLGVAPGPQISHLLNEIHQAQVMEKVKTRQEALKYASELLSDDYGGYPHPDPLP